MLCVELRPVLHLRGIEGIPASPSGSQVRNPHPPISTSEPCPVFPRQALGVEKARSVQAGPSISLVPQFAYPTALHACSYSSPPNVVASPISHPPLAQAHLQANHLPRCCPTQWVVCRPSACLCSPVPHITRCMNLPSSPASATSPTPPSVLVLCRGGTGHVMAL